MPVYIRTHTYTKKNVQQIESVDKKKHANVQRNERATGPPSPASILSTRISKTQSLVEAFSD